MRVKKLDVWLDPERSLQSHVKETRTAFYQLRNAAKTRTTFYPRTLQRFLSMHVCLHTLIIVTLFFLLYQRKF